MELSEDFIIASAFVEVALMNFNKKLMIMKLLKISEILLQKIHKNV
jgi:hypothetical protein